MNILELKKIRNTYNLSRIEFAEKLNISKDTLDLWEYRNKEVPSDKIEYIKNVFNMYFDKSKIIQGDAKESTSFENLPLEEKLNIIYKHSLAREKELNDKINSIEEKLRMSQLVTRTYLRSIITKYKIKPEEIYVAEEIEQDIIENKKQLPN